MHFYFGITKKVADQLIAGTFSFSRVCTISFYEAACCCSVFGFYIPSVFLGVSLEFRGATGPFETNGDVIVVGCLGLSYSSNNPNRPYVSSCGWVCAEGRCVPFFGDFFLPSVVLAAALRTALENNSQSLLS